MHAILRSGHAVRTVPANHRIDTDRFAAGHAGRYAATQLLVCVNNASLVCWLMKVSEILRMLQEDGWFLVATRGSHRQFKHAEKPGRVTVPGKNLPTTWHLER